MSLGTSFSAAGVPSLYRSNPNEKSAGIIDAAPSARGAFSVSSAIVCSRRILKLPGVGSLSAATYPPSDTMPYSSLFHSATFARLSFSTAIFSLLGKGFIL